MILVSLIKQKFLLTKKGSEPILEDVKKEQTFFDLVNLKNKRKK